MPSLPDGASPAVLAWWAGMSAIAVLNLVAWGWSARALGRRPPDARSACRRRQLRLSLVFVAICAFRSFLPRADVQRICLVDSLWSSVLVGRSVATVAELCFMAQWALALRDSAIALEGRFAAAASRALVPMIAFAEICSWSSVITTSYLGNAVEESMWALSATLGVGAGLSLLPRVARRDRRLLAVALAFGVAYVGFMATVDVPMYLSRWAADEAAGRTYMGLVAGLRDLAQRRVVTFSWNDWHDEMAWMALYFSVAVWFSLALVHAPRLRPRPRKP